MSAISVGGLLLLLPSEYAAVCFLTNFKPENGSISLCILINLSYKALLPSTEEHCKIVSEILRFVSLLSIDISFTFLLVCPTPTTKMN